MAGYTAQDVKKLRELTDAPMMECKSALEESEGDFERAKEILREKGKASAGKKAGRATSAGALAFAASEDGKTVGAAYVESETDFVANNENFVGMVQAVADWVLANGSADDAKKAEFGEEIIAKFRENCVVTTAEQFTSESAIRTYVHHDRTKGALVLSTGDHAGSEAIRKIAVHIVSNPAEVLKKEDLSQEKLDSEYKIQLERALLEGKPENIAKNIAQGRINKEFIKEVVLLEQPVYIEPSKTVAQYLAEEAKGTSITGFRYFAAGQGPTIEA